MRDPSEAVCVEIVEVVTDYLEGALDVEDRARFEQHLFACVWCMNYLRQMRGTIDLTKGLAAADPVDPAALAATFRRWRETK